MNDHTPPEPGASDLSLDGFLSDVLPEIKLALGEQIDRENARALPGRYARMLPETLLVATLRPDAAEAIASVAPQVERELTNSCTRHGSLYDRAYRVQLRRAMTADAPLFEITAHAGQAAEPPPAAAAPPGPDAPASARAGAGTAAAMPAADPDATRVDGMEATPGWDAERWILVVEDLEGTEHEVFRLLEPFTTVGRRSDDPRLRVTVALRDVPHVSRRQLALLWAGTEDEPVFQLYNLGLNPLHVHGAEIPGARAGREVPDLESIGSTHVARVSVDDPIRVGEQGPVLRIRELPEPADDPDATRFE
jgi:hypothetical protein